MNLDFHRCSECGEMWTRPKFRKCKHDALVVTLSSEDVLVWDKDAEKDGDNLS